MNSEPYSALKFTRPLKDVSCLPKVPFLLLVRRQLFVAIKSSIANVARQGLVCGSLAIERSSGMTPEEQQQQQEYQKQGRRIEEEKQFHYFKPHFHPLSVFEESRAASVKQEAVQSTSNTTTVILMISDWSSLGGE